MARTLRADYIRSNRVRSLPLPAVNGTIEAAGRLLAVRDASSRRLYGQQLLAVLARQCEVSIPELVVPDDPQPHRRARGRIVFSQQGEYRRREPSRDDPRTARGGKPLGRIRVHNRTPARGAPVRGSAFLHTLLHEFCHHHDTEALGLHSSFHTAGFFARVRHLRQQIEHHRRRVDEAADRDAMRNPPSRAGHLPGLKEPQAREEPTEVHPGLQRLWSIIRNL